jgi:hypothetical protein
MDPVSKAQAQTQNSHLARFGDRLKQFKPGQSGNPGGRPRKKHLTNELEKMVRSKDGKEFVKEVIHDILDKRGMAAVLLIREILERTEGSVKQEMELTGELTLTDRMASARERAAKIVECLPLQKSA